MKLTGEKREQRYRQAKQAYELHQQKQTFRAIEAELHLAEAGKMVRWFERIKEWEEKNGKSWL